LRAVEATAAHHLASIGLVRAAEGFRETVWMRRKIAVLAHIPTPSLRRATMAATLVLTF